ncbi:MAG: hydroxymethylglutaryl-CoA synthase family protein [Alphaproteobacteria bacterium]|nr:hydroxymethylglutaryl-CoA synthase family protein [Alphaproteobacteria bacterium]
MVGILAYGGYVPRLRLKRAAAVAANAWFAPGLKSYAQGERSICNWDEDTLTMAVAAARDCLGPTPPKSLAALYLASTTHPFADRQNAAVVATALNLPADLATSDVSGTQRAGTSGLITALNVVRGTGNPALYIAADNRRTKSGSAGELLYGAGAAALVLGPDDGTAEFVASHQIAVDFVDHYRAEGEEFDYGWEERWIRDEGFARLVPQALTGLFAKTDIKPNEIDYFVLPCVFRGVVQGIVKRIGIREAAVSDNLHTVMGEAGAAHAVVMLARLLETAKPGQTILVASFGQGCDALLFRATDRIAMTRPSRGISGFLARRKEETNYQKFLAFNDLVVRDLGMRSEVDKQTAMTTLYRNKEMILGFVGGKCRVCGTLQYPKSNICVNPNCGAVHSQDNHPFADTPAEILTWTADNLTFTADPPAHYGIVQFAAGGRFLADFTDVDPGTIDVGQPMRMTFRIKDRDRQRGFVRYFWKAAPG